MRISEEPKNKWLTTEAVLFPSKKPKTTPTKQKPNNHKPIQVFIKINWICVWWENLWHGGKTKRRACTWNREVQQNQRSKARHRPQITQCPKLCCSCIVKCLQKNHTQGYFWPIPGVSLLRDCYIPMSLISVAKIRSTADNSQRHIPPPHLPRKCP